MADRVFGTVGCGQLSDWGYLLRRLGNVNYYTAIDGGVYPITQLLNACVMGLDNYPGNEKWKPRYLETGNPSDALVSGGVPLQTSPGSSTFVPGVIIPVTQPQPTVEPTDVVTGPRPAFVDVIGGPESRPLPEVVTTPATETGGPEFRPLPEISGARAIDIPAALQVISKAGKLVNAAAGELRIAPIPIPSGDPVSIVINIGLILGGLFKGLFGGGDKELKRSVEKLRDAFVEGSRQQTKFTWKTAFGLGYLLIAVGKLWVRVVRPLLDAVRRVVDEVRRIYEKILRPIFQTIEKIRRHILEIYTKFVRPVIEAIQKVRRALFIVRLFNRKLADAIDRRLAGIQAAIARPFAEVEKYLQAVAAWINVIVTAGGLLQPTTLLNSLAAGADEWIKMFYEGHSSPLDDLSRARIYTRPRVLSIDEARAEARRAALDGQGDVADKIRAGEREARSLLSL